jgi:hypothetical protein
MAAARPGRVLLRSGGTMTYVYDLGDWWDHRRVDHRHRGPTHTPVGVTGHGDASVQDWHRRRGRDSTPLDADEINQRVARIAAEVQGRQGSGSR